MNRRNLLKALLVLPATAVAAPLAALAPKPFAKGGLVSHEVGTIVIHNCSLPISMVHTRSSKPGNVEIEIHCDVSRLQADLSSLPDTIRRIIAQEAMRKRLR